MQSRLSASTVILRPGWAGAAALRHPEVGAADLLGAVDERTRELLNRRRWARRGRLLRRSLVVADVVGLSLAFGLVVLAYAGEGPGGDATLRTEAAAFLLTLPFWPVVAKLHGLYDRDEWNPDHSSVDDVVGVFHLVTVCCWLLLAGCLLAGVSTVEQHKLVTFWLAAVLGAAADPSGGPSEVPGQRLLPAERDHPGRRGRGAAGGAQAHQPPRVRRQRGRVPRPAPQGATRGPARAPDGLRRHRAAAGGHRAAGHRARHRGVLERGRPAARSSASAD